MPIFILILIALSLSMDAFSLSLAYGTLNIKKKNAYFLSIVVGFFHFIMPIIGVNVGKTIIRVLPIETDILIFIILTLIGIEMIIETFKGEEEVKILSFLGNFIFGFAVSLDSFSLGLGLKTIYENFYLSALFFAISSMIFTYIGLKLGRYINKKIGNYSTLFGGIILIIIGITYLV